MSKKTRGAFALIAAGALTVTMAPNAFAAKIDRDPAFTYTGWDAGVHRIAEKDSIETAIEASKSRTDWGWVKLAGPEFQCSVADLTINGTAAEGYTVGDVVQLWIDDEGNISGDPTARQVTCHIVQGVAATGIDIIIARTDDYSDALAATPLADVLDAPVLVNPTAKLDARVKAEIQRLSAGKDRVRVHLLGGTNALSHAVENEIDKIRKDLKTFRYQGIDRYETAVKLAWETITRYKFDNRLAPQNVNVYLTTGVNFPDALTAGTAAAHNDGVVLLTKGETLDARNFTDNFLINLNDFVRDDRKDAPRWLRDINTSEIFAVGGPSVRAAATHDIRLAKSYDGATRYETATLVAQGTFKNPSYFAVASGESYNDAVVASAYIANADGPLVLSKNDALSPATKAYLGKNVENSDTVITFGSNNYSLKLSVTDEIKTLLKW